MTAITVTAVHIPAFMARFTHMPMRSGTMATPMPITITADVDMRQAITTISAIATAIRMHTDITVIRM